jgi:hypothetical protein
VPRLHALEDRTLLNTYPVTNLADSGDGSLRQAILDADQAGGDNAITFGVAGTLTLESALPDVSTNLLLEDLGPARLTVQRDLSPGTPDFTILTVDPNVTVTISGLTLTNGSGFYGGGIFNDGGTLTVQFCSIAGNTAWRGGGILNLGDLTINASTLSGNSTDNEGGGIANFGPLTIDHSILTGNEGSIGGAIYNFESASLIVHYSTLALNDASFGGAIANNSGTVLVDSSTVASNTAAIGGGIGNSYGGTVTVVNSTFNGNVATHAEGGGIANEEGAALYVIDSTVAGNAAASGGGIANAGTMAARNIILAGNQAPSGADLSGDLGSLGHNLIGNAEGGSGFDSTDLLYVDPLLGTLQDNGGTTWTMALLPGSPALGAGDPTDSPEFDQRGPGFARVIKRTIDIGAFEVQDGDRVRLKQTHSATSDAALGGTADSLPALAARGTSHAAGAVPKQPVIAESAPTPGATALVRLFAVAKVHDAQAVGALRIAALAGWPDEWRAVLDSQDAV